MKLSNCKTCKAQPAMVQTDSYWFVKCPCGATSALRTTADNAARSWNDNAAGYVARGCP